MGSELSPTCPASGGLADFQGLPCPSVQPPAATQAETQALLSCRKSPGALFPPREEQSPCSRGLQATTSPYLPPDTDVAMIC